MADGPVTMETLMELVTRRDVLAFLEREPSGATSAARTSSTRTSSARTSPARTSAARTSAARTSPARTSAARTSPARTSPARASLAPTSAARTSRARVSLARRCRLVVRRERGHPRHVGRTGVPVSSAMPSTLGAYVKQLRLRSAGEQTLWLAARLPDAVDAGKEAKSYP
jgi:hypothetical protein